MMFTARQLAALHKAAASKGPVILPYRARLTPLAVDLVRSGKITVGYSDAAANPATRSSPQKPRELAPGVPPVASAQYLWWCDGPCGPAKAAVSMEAKQIALNEIKPSPGSDALVSAIKTLAAQVKAGAAIGGLLLVESAGAAVVLANRNPSLRAIVGTSLIAVEQGLNQVAANVLVIEHPRQSLSQVRNLLARFLHAKRTLGDATKRTLAELAS
jgi:hypothetical protein